MQNYSYVFRGWGAFVDPGFSLVEYRKIVVKNRPYLYFFIRLVAVGSHRNKSITRIKKAAELSSSGKPQKPNENNLSTLILCSPKPTLSRGKS